MTILNKSKLTIIFAALFFIGIAATSCTNGESKKEAKKDSLDNGNTKPTPDKP